MDLAIVTDSRRSLTVYTGGNKAAPTRRTRTLFHPTQTVIAVGIEDGARRYDVIARNVVEFSPEFTA